MFWRDRGREMVDAGWASAQARRPDNQDRCACTPRWAVLSDGIGGYAGGAVAAELAVDAAVAALAPARGDQVAAVRYAMDLANAEVRAGQQRHPELAYMGATLTLAVAGGRGPWTVANVGDSPAWLVRPDQTQLVSEDHNLAAELLQRGIISADDAVRHPGRHVLSRAIGIEALVVPAVRRVEVGPGDRLVLASDGLGTGVDPDMLHELLGPPGEATAAEQAERLVSLALAGGASDNVTVVVLCRVASSPVAIAPGAHRRAARRPSVWR